MALRVAAIGTGYFSQYHYDAWTRIPGATLAAACTRSSAEKLAEVAARYGIARTYLDAARMLDEVVQAATHFVTGDAS